MAGPEQQPGTPHTLAVLKKLTAVHVHKCSLTGEDVSVCYKNGDFRYIGEEWPGNGVRRPLGQCRYCFEVYPLDVFDLDGKETDEE